MENTRLIIQIFSIVLGCLATLTSIPILLRLHWPSPMLWIVKLLVSALSSLLFLIGIWCIVMGLTIGPVYIIFIGVYLALFFFMHIYRITRPPDVSSGFAQAFGVNWGNQISAEQ